MSINEVGKIYERPWGTYQTLAMAEGYQVKVITVNPGGILSLQKHFKRAEHWVVVKGTPTFTIGNDIRDYEANRHVFIPVEEIHRMANHTDSPVEIIEVQVGPYLGEDDIERLEDVYDR
jgi:mannose-6-phosphate isomerase-like protein (cupin superfamily)